MGLCTYCGQKAGWLHEAHDACIQRAQQGLSSLEACVAEAVVQGKAYDAVREQVDRLVRNSAIPGQQVLPAITDGWNKGAVARSMQQPISGAEFSAISNFYRAAGVPAENIKQSAGLRAMAFSFLIWTVLNDQIDPYVGPIHFNLQAGEVPVFGIANVLLSEERVASSYVGAYSGASIRVARGFYYHLGGMGGHRVQSRSIQEVDYGDFLMTTQAVYFGGREHGLNFRLPYKHIVRFQPYADAIGICKNGGKEQMFAPQQLADCGWFLFNVLQALAAAG
jgi:hypothetical protein